MPAQRKIFRIEETMRDIASDRAPGLKTGSTDLQADILAEMRELRALMQAHTPAAGPHMVAAAHSPDVRKLKIELDVISDAIKQTRNEIVSLQEQGFDSSRVARVTKELEAVVAGTTSATDRILKAAEGIDETTVALITLLKNGHEKGLAQDIQDGVTAIFEACNFHDLTGQRISKVTVTLKMVEDHLARMMEIWGVIERFNVGAAQSAVDDLSLLNGPKLDGDNGHSTQDDIDKLFG